MIGQLISINRGLHIIKSDEQIYKVKTAGKLRHNNIKPIVGDIVEFDPEGFLIDVKPRKNSLVRPKVSNVDQALIVTSLVEPNYSSILLNKFLAIIEHNEIEPVIVFTKKELTDETHKKEYEDQGYKVFEIDNVSKSGITELAKIFENKLSVFTGQTGAGKSSTINSLTNFDLKTNEISKSLGRGKHTTRLVEIYDWMGGQLIDTPGFSSLEFNLTKLQLSRSYHDFEEAAKDCKFPRSCIHNKEQDCGVKTKVEKGEISQQRYDDYLRLLKEANDEKIAASILGKDNKPELVNMLIDRGITAIHYDVMDGEFVSNTSLPIPEVLDIFDNTKPHYKDVHLMVKNPSDYIEELINKADQVSIHFESFKKDELKSFIEKYHDKVKLGIAINPDTKINDVFEYIKFLNHVMIMSVVPGKGGQTFIETSLEKIKDLKAEVERQGENLILEIDGGINNIWGPVVFKEGINIAVSGSYLINNIDNNSIGLLLGDK